MKDKVYISVRGLHLTSQSEGYDEDEEPIEVINVGTYKVVNGKEYIKYDEIYEGDSGKSTSIIKIADGAVEITKKGSVTTHLSFVQGEKTMTFYETPFGNIYLGIFSREVDIQRTEDTIKISIDYSLELNYEQVSDAKVVIDISSRGNFSL